MKQHSINIEMIKQVAIGLGPLRPKAVFLGGSATGFHITDKAEPEIRATKDVDIIVEVASRVEYHQLEKTLRELGFFQKMQKDDPLCRWCINDVIVDVMPTNENILGFSNRWYLAAINNSVTIELERDLENEIFLEALPGHLLPDQASQARRSIILERIKKIVDLGNN